MAKSALPVVEERHNALPSRPRYLKRSNMALALFGLAICFGWMPRVLDIADNARNARFHTIGTTKHHQCKQTPALWPTTSSDRLRQAYDSLFTEKFQNASISRLSGAVKVQTESFDDMGAIGEDKRWDVFYNFYDYLQTIFPTIHSSLNVEKVNTHGLVYTWEGSDERKKPMVLMAHQDVVPVDPDTVDSWTHPPWSGHFDGERIWGRGASDCKNQLIGALETIAILLEAGFQPKRTIVLSFGFDEEISGAEGAGHLSQFLLKRYGKNGVAALLDEGMGYLEAFGRGFAVPGVAEKGYTDVDVTVRTPGGHSSVPRDHTSIGILAELITAVEAVQYPTYLADENPYLGLLQCGAEYAPDFPKKIRHLLGQRKSSTGKEICARAKHHDKLAIEVAKSSPAVRYLMQTSQAVDIINGGRKTNAMPESATATINHRINIGDRPKTVWHHISQLAKPIAKKYNLTLHAFDGEEKAYNSISLSSRKTVLEAAPVTPTRNDVVSPWMVLGGTIRALYSEDTIVAPALMTGNTDTRYYWDLTGNIFRFGPGYVKEDDSSLGKIHTVDESITISNHLKVVRWFTLFLRNMDDAVLEGEE